MHPQLPIIYVSSSSLETSGPQTDGMLRQNAIVNQCKDLCASRMLAKPRTSSAVHHHGEQNDGGKRKQELKVGDFALIPAWVEHQEVNEGDEDVVWCIVRSGEVPIVVNLPGGWGTS
ncbi:hypothetical protein AC578_1440 [Pseudocercospora eumusae]|uniref:Cupin type-2 domain-containing protein n=1 Tax=Pseudocercospora eumusae TaxID=321146 RepID=A0A139HUP1_9PEZI|nr:hypothetical protein AC578_1440 [Pseudocercospora eumusae]